jgi:hypothetical protein
MLAFGGFCLGYFWIKFEEPFYHFESIHDNYYISEYSYADKSIWTRTNRKRYLPVLNFVERSYWLWLVFSFPGLIKIWKNPKSPGQ